MEKTRIGGGLLAATGIAAPWIAQMMGLTVPATVGWVLLGLCAVAALLGLVMLFWRTHDVERAPPRQLETRVKLDGPDAHLKNAIVRGGDIGIHSTGPGVRLSNIEIISDGREGGVGLLIGKHPNALEERANAAPKPLWVCEGHNRHP